jgi:hypothetical protein
MRYYDLTITADGSTTPFRHWTSHPSGQFDPGALDIELDMPLTAYATPVGGQIITIHGVPLEDLGQAQQFTGMALTLYGGMKAGLPLANPSQAGLLIKGYILQSYGNWEGTEMTLDLVVYPSKYTMENPGNFVLNWRAQQPLDEAIRNSLSIAYPGIPISINIGSNLVNNHDEIGYYSTLEEFSTVVGSITEHSFQQRVEVAMWGGKIFIYDSTHNPTPIQINFTDLIGQPTWIEPNTMQVKTVMRADLQISARISMPKGFQNLPGFANTTQASLPSSIKYQSAFQNDFQIVEMRHLGHYRSHDSADWCTVFNCVTGGLSS